MKRILAVLACSLFLAGCGNGSDNGGEANSSSQAGGQSDNASRQSSQTQSDSGNAAHKTENGFASERAKQSYALGMNIGRSLQNGPIDVQIDHLIAGIKDQLGSGQPRLTDKQAGKVIASLMEQMRAEKQGQRQQKAAENLEQSRQFLTRNRKKAGVKTTKSGLQYKVIEKGNGPSADKNDVVTVSYVGKLPNGKVFDATKEGETAKFPVNAVIRGWTEALRMMHEGAKYKLFIPPDLAYGKRGAGRLIGPNQVLIFTLTLENVKSVENSGKALQRDDSNSSQ